MGLMPVKKITLLFLLISASFLSTFAGRQSMFVNELAEGEDVKELSSQPLDSNEMRTIRERFLKVNTKDYGTFDPAPALVRPPFKLIPN